MHIIQTYEWEHYQMLVSYSPAGASHTYCVLSDHTTFLAFLEWAMGNAERKPCNISIMFLDEESFQWYVDQGTPIVGE